MTKRLFPKPLMWLVDAIIVLLLMSFFIWFYAHGYPHSPCCDTTMTLVRAERIAETGTLNPTSPFNPSYPIPLYGSPISTEIVTHLILAGIYWANPGLVGNLVFAKWFFTVLFSLAVIPIYGLVADWLKSRALGVVAVMLIYPAFWFGNMFWTGHVAQFLGSALVVSGVWLFMRYEQKPSRRLLSWIVAINLLLFFVHVLSFLVFFLITLVAGSRIWYHKVRPIHRWWIPVGWLVYALIATIYLRYLPSATRLSPVFELTSMQEGFSTVVENAFGPMLILALALVGVVMLLIKKNFIPLIWLLVTYLLSQTGRLEIPFFPYRFSEFLVVPLGLMVVVGLNSLRQAVSDRRIFLMTLVVTLLIILPFSFRFQDHLKKCYVANCPTLNPTQITQADIVAYRWLDGELPSTARIIGFQKFAFMLPVFTDRSVELPEGEKRDIFTDSDPQVRVALAQKYGVTHIFWSSIFDAMDHQIIDGGDYQEKPFANQRYFTKVYDQSGVRIYAVR